MNEASVVNFKVEDGSFKLGVDTNKDGQNVVELILKMSEAVAEAFSRGTKLEHVKLVDLGFEGTKLVLKLDTDQDGEQLLELKVDLSELADEIQSAVK
jgi:hypothetical protein